ncbi:MAG: precorrin-6Y C5,15-methyltransferase (decarboxylating) subunit CbiT [Saccharolobus sp.]
MRWEYNVPGIPDNYFDRDEEIPMTKEEIRVLALSKLRLKRGETVLDIGCGTGSVTIEASLIVGDRGKVYGIDKNEKAINLTRKNAEKFDVLNNIVLIKGEAPEIFLSLDTKFDKVFIGGGSERIDEILRALWNMLNSKARVVIDAILVETVARAIKAMEEIGFGNVEVTEVIIAKGMKTRMGTAMMSRNPIFIISGEKI